VLTGVVVDGASGEPITAAFVRLIELRRDDITHQDGSFALRNVGAGTHTLVVQRLGYRTETRRIAISGDVVPPLLRIELTSSPMQLQEVVVTGVVGARSRDAPLRLTTVVGGQELDRKLESTVAGTLRNEPGMAATSLGPATTRPVIRGLGGERILVLEDGARVGDLAGGSPDHAVAVEPITARQLEVVRGPAALLYGSNALGGVLNVVREDIPRSLPDAVHGTIGVQGQSVYRGAMVGGHVSTALGDVALRGEASGRMTGDMRTPVGTMANSDSRTVNAALGAGWIRSSGHLGGSYRYYFSQYGIPGGFPGAHTEGVTIDMERHMGRGEFQRRRDMGPFDRLDATASVSSYWHRETEATGVVGTEFTMLTAATDAIARHDRQWIFTQGAVGMRAQYRDFAAGGSVGTPPARDLALALFALEQYDTGPLQLELGARYDFHRVEPLDDAAAINIGNIRTRTFGSFSGSFGGLLRVAEGVQLGATVNRAFRTPDFTELFSDGPHLAAFREEIGNPDLREEVGVGLDGFVRIRRGPVRAEIATFRNVIDNYIYPRFTGDTGRLELPVYQFQGERAQYTGVEGTVEWTVLPNVLIESTVSQVRGTLTTTNEPVPFIPPLNGMLNVRYDRPAFFAGVGMRAAASQRRVGEDPLDIPTDGFTTFNVQGGYRWTMGGQLHSVTLRVENLTDREYREHLSRTKVIMPEAGRDISLLYRVTF
jgi:iron complex outermembrane recepter protein